MFTHDVRKKAKKWHDGSLRFHTFNKRVMVYDDTKNLVGSLHYRSQEDFVEGIELNLDSHVLVQVEEKLSESTTDLTPLLSRQKQDGVEHFAKPDPPTRATLSRINAANSQIKPKSIRELLAASQGSTGRARLPSKSPYEERHPFTETQPPEPEPEPKRRKILPDKDKNKDKENNVEVLKPVQPSTKRKTSVVHTRPEPPTGIVDISSDDEVTLFPQNGRNNIRTQPTLPESSETTLLPSNTTSNAKRTLTQPASAEPKRHKKNHQAQSEPPLPRLKEQASKKPNKTREEPVGNPAKPSSASPVLSKPLSAETSVSQIRHPTGPRSSLKFAAERSRPKLMYRALLVDSSKSSSDISSTAATSDSAKGTSSTRVHDNERPIRRPRPTNMIDTDRFFAPSQLARDAAAAAVTTEPSRGSSMSDGSLHPNRLGSEDAQMTPESNHSSGAVPILDKDVAATVPDSPLFLPRTASQISPLPSQDLAIDDSHVSFLSQALNVTRPRKSISPVQGAMPSTQSSTGTGSSRQSPEPPSSPVFHKLLSRNAFSDKPGLDTNPSEADEAHNNASAPAPAADRTLLPIPPVLPAQVRLFRRVLSENVERTGMSSDVSPDDSDDGNDSFAGLPENGIHGKSPKRLEKPQIQSHSFSDPVEIRPASPTPDSASSSPGINDGTQEADAGDATTTIPAMAEATTEYISIEESGPWTSTEAFLLFDWWPPGRQKPPYAADTSRANSGSERVGNNEAAKSNTNMMSKKKYGTFGSAKFVSQR